jgi:hypothetical protein
VVLYSKEDPERIFAISTSLSKYMPKIFISYSHKDKDFVGILAENLQRVGHNVWWDTTDIQSGDEISDEITNAIASSKYVIVVLTPDSVKSKWVKSEYTEALNQEKKIIPIMLRQCKVPITLNIFNYSDFTKGENYQDNLNKLLSSFGNTGKLSAVSATEPTVPRSPGLLRYRVPLFIIVGLSLLFFVAWFLLPESPAISIVIPTPSAITASINTHQSATSSPTAKAARTIPPTTIPTTIPTEIIIILSDGSRTSHECPDSAQPALLNTGERVRFEFSTGMTEEDFGKLEWWAFVSASKEKISVGKIAFYSQTNEGGIIYVRLGNVTICTLKIQPTP